MHEKTSEYGKHGKAGKEFHENNITKNGSATMEFQRRLCVHLIRHMDQRTSTAQVLREISQKITVAEKSRSQ